MILLEQYFLDNAYDGAREKIIFKELFLLLDYFFYALYIGATEKNDF